MSLQRYSAPIDGIPQYATISKAWSTSSIAITLSLLAVMPLQYTDLLAAVMLGFVFFCYLQVRGLLDNIAEARSSGLKYVILPIFPFGAPWAIAQQSLLPLLRLLPEDWTHVPCGEPDTLALVQTDTLCIDCSCQRAALGMLATNPSENSALIRSLLSRLLGIYCSPATPTQSTRFSGATSLTSLTF